MVVHLNFKTFIGLSRLPGPSRFFFKIHQWRKKTNFDKETLNFILLLVQIFLRPVIEYAAGSYRLQLTSTIDTGIWTISLNNRWKLRRVLTIVRAGVAKISYFSCVRCTRIKIVHTTCYTIELPTNRLPFMIRVTSICEK